MRMLDLPDDAVEVVTDLYAGATTSLRLPAGGTL